MQVCRLCAGPFGAVRLSLPLQVRTWGEGLACLALGPRAQGGGDGIW